MLSKDDLKAIDGLLKPIRQDLSEVKETLETHTGSIMEIEKDIKSALELRQDVSEVREQVKDHEERLTHLENN